MKSKKEMAEYIMREIVEEMIKEQFTLDDNDLRYIKQMVVEKLPSIDIVHCSECKYQYKTADGFCWCNRAVVDMSDYGDSCVVADDDNYCSFGEKKEKSNG